MDAKKAQKWAISLAAVSALVSVGGVVAVQSSASAATMAIYWGCEGDYTEYSTYTYGTEVQYNCDYIQVRTYTYLGGGNTTTTYGPQGVIASSASKVSGGTYSGGAGNQRYNGAWYGWKEI